ncbi:very long-chain acyl-CoA synthetase domain protein [Mycobacterium xenopi 4042]|uniref:Very long-chain acyl-CoA synthetase domain protein n=1 Tax=Mycobacterium xenopi 4042 TaxID=1299334 RepID=X8E077_MYCXE|nr:very long-chain acyl-CoA synthetase domain protein [Mycobacterium xenopi 4042]
MAAVKLRGDAEFDGKALAETVYDRLPGYALPLFVRVVESMEHTTTFKSRKVDLREQAYGPASRTRCMCWPAATRATCRFTPIPDEVAAGKRPRP